MVRAIDPPQPPLIKGGRYSPALAFTLALALVGAMAAGCASTSTIAGGVVETQPAVAEKPVNPSNLDDMSFLHDYLVRQPMVSVDDGYRAMLILADGQCTAKTFEEREATLERRGISRPAWKLQAEEHFDRGTVAYMVCTILKIRGGVDRVLLGSWGLGDRRYALRELIYREMMAESPPYRYVTGAELVALLGKADGYMQKHHEYQAPSIELPPPPPPGSPIEPESIEGQKSEP
jgi:hypothetical protein